MAHRPCIWLPLLAIWAMQAGPRPAQADGVGLRIAIHPGFTRLVLDAGSGPGATTISEDHDRVTIALADPTLTLDPGGVAGAGLHNVLSVESQPGRVIVRLRQGVVLHSFGLGRRRVLDLLDPPISAASVTTLPARSLAAALPPAVMPIALAPLEVAAPSASSSPSPPSSPSPSSPSPSSLPPPTARGLGPAPERPPRPLLQAESGTAEAMLSLPLAADTGAAAFRRGALTMVVFDEPRALDLPSLQIHPPFETARVTLLPHATILSLELGAGRTLSLDHQGVTWSLTVTADTGAPVGGGLTPQVERGRLRLALAKPGRVVVVPDPATGDDLLVGTVRSTGDHIDRPRRFAQFSLLPTMLGVLVDPLDDHLRLTADIAGDTVDTAAVASPLALLPPGAAPAMIDPARFSRCFDLPAETTGSLLHRLQTQVADAAASPARDRLPFRRAVAQTMLALGLGPEAQGVLAAAAIDAPRALSDLPTQTLAAAAALIAGRLAETAALAQPGAPDSDERRLWRGLRAGALLPDGQRPDAATLADLAGAADLLLAYPAALQHSLLPLAADTLLRGGARAAAERLLQARPDDHDLDLARAADQQIQGATESALAAFDRLGNSADRSVRARALVAALDLRVATGRLTPEAAAQAGMKLIYAWRGDARERDLRLRVAAWQGQAGAFHDQLATLRDALAAFPAATGHVHDQLAAAFSTLLHQPGAGLDRIAPLDLVALMQENADLLPDGPAGEALAGLLADRLHALDLPRQEAQALSGLLRHAAPPARAALGVRLAMLDLETGDPQAALQALTQSDPGGDTVSSALTEQRSLVRAQADAQLGNRPAALASLATSTAAPALLARAALHEDAHDWTQAGADLASLAATLPAAGTLTGDQTALLLRWASALAQLGDEPRLADIRRRYAGRLPDKDDAALLAVLTEPPIRDVSDLPRAAAETVAARILSRPAATLQPPSKSAPAAARPQTP